MAIDARERRQVLSRLESTNPWRDWVARHRQNRPRVEPFPFQRELFDAQEKYVLLTGGMRGGKTVAGAMKCLRACAWYPGMPALVARKTGPSLERYTVPVYQDCLPPTWGGVYRKSDRHIELPNGSQIWFVALEDPGDLEKMKGANWGFIHWDEPTEGTAEHFSFLQTRLSFLGGPRQMVLTANNAGRGWLYDFFRRKAGPDKRVIISSTFDNTVLAEDYREQFREWPERLVRKYLKGGFDTLEGQLFSHFDESVHVVDPKPPAALPVHWVRWRAMDTGWDHPTTAVLLAKDERDNIYVVDEYSQSNVPPQQHAEELTARHQAYAPVLFTVIDPAAAGQGKEMGLGSVMQAYAAHGFYVQPVAERDVFSGLSQIASRLANAVAEKDGGLFICANCQGVVDQIVNCEIYTTAVGTEKVRKGKDDLLDALRYGIVSAPSAPTIEEVPTYEQRLARSMRLTERMDGLLGDSEEIGFVID